MKHQLDTEDIEFFYKQWIAKYFDNSDTPELRQAFDWACQCGMRVLIEVGESLRSAAKN